MPEFKLSQTSYGESIFHLVIFASSRVKTTREYFSIMHIVSYFWENWNFSALMDFVIAICHISLLSFSLVWDFKLFSEYLRQLKSDFGDFMFMKIPFLWREKLYEFEP